jgi:hypothetical protein
MGQRYHGYNRELLAAHEDPSREEGASIDEDERGESSMVAHEGVCVERDEAPAALFSVATLKCGRVNAQVALKCARAPNGTLRSKVDVQTAHKRTNSPASASPCCPPRSNACPAAGPGAPHELPLRVAAAAKEHR